MPAARDRRLGAVGRRSAGAQDYVARMGAPIVIRADGLAASKA